MRPAPASLWLHDRPLVLASGSGTRKALLAAAGIPLVVDVADIDERGLEAPLLSAQAGPGEIAGHLASAKAGAVCGRHPGCLVLGADQTLALNGKLLHKPASLGEAKNHLLALSGHTHELHAAVSVWRDDAEIFRATKLARLTMRRLGPSFITSYLSAIGPAALASVGSYQLEGMGIHLFDSLEGDQSTILGLPLMPLLAFFRQSGCVAV